MRVCGLLEVKSEKRFCRASLFLLCVGIVFWRLADYGGLRITGS